MSLSKAKVLETVTFKTKNDFSVAQVQEAAKNAEKVIKNFDGFIHRTIAFSEEKQEWTDLVYWESMGQAEQAAKQVMNHEECLNFFGMIDESTMDFRHLNIL